MYMKSVYTWITAPILMTALSVAHAALVDVRPEARPGELFQEAAPIGSNSVGNVSAKLAKGLGTDLTSFKLATEEYLSVPLVHLTLDLQAVYGADGQHIVALIP